MINKLVGTEIYLRPIALADVTETYVGWLNDPKVNQYLESRFTRHTLGSVREYVSGILGSEENRFFAICLKQGNRHVGNIKLGNIHSHHRSADIGLFIGDAEAWGKGYGSEAIGLLTEFAFGELDLRKLIAGCYAKNLASIAAFEKRGWRREGLLRGQIIVDGTPDDLVLLGTSRKV